MTKETSESTPETVLVAEHLSARGYDVVFVNAETIELYEDGAFKETELEIDEILEDGSRKREIIVIGGGPSISRLRPRLGLNVGVLADAVMKSALICGPERILDNDLQHDWLYEDASTYKEKPVRKHLTAGESKTRAKKLKAQRHSRRYNRKR
jgi:hypothetical protein